MLDCLGELGLYDYQEQFVEFLLKEIFEHNQLVNCLESAIRYWVKQIKNPSRQKQLAQYIVTELEKRTNHT